MFGLEESYGCLAGTHARDKDAIVAGTQHHASSGSSKYSTLDFGSPVFPSAPVAMSTILWAGGQGFLPVLYPGP